MMSDLFEQFKAYLVDHDRAALTISGYLSDLRLFARWFEQTNAECFTPQAVTPSDVREYRQYLLDVEHRKANTVNRKLAALTVFMQFAIEAHLIEHDPTAAIKYVEEAPRGPRYLDKQQQFALAARHRAGSAILTGAVSKALAVAPARCLVGAVPVAHGFARQ